MNVNTYHLSSTLLNSLYNRYMNTYPQKVYGYKNGIIPTYVFFSSNEIK